MLSAGITFILNFVKIDQLEKINGQMHCINVVLSKMCQSSNRRFWNDGNEWEFYSQRSVGMVGLVSRLGVGGWKKGLLYEISFSRGWCGEQVDRQSDRNNFDDVARLQMWQPVLGSIPGRLTRDEHNWAFGRQSNLYATKET
jgi:hypothetical protein